MEQQTPEKKVTVSHNALNYGLILGVIQIILSLLFYMLNVETDSFIRYLSMIIMIVGIVFGILNYRKKINNGFISYGQSLGTGVLIGLFCAILFSIYFFFFAKFIDTDLISEILRKKEEAMASDPRFTPEIIEQSMHYTRMFVQPWIMSLFTVLGMTFGCFIASLIISIFTQKKDNSFESNFK